MPVYTSTSPAALEVLAVSQPLIQQNFAYLQSDIGVDHNFSGNTGTATDGYHNQVSFAANIAAPGLRNGVSDLFVNLIGGQSQLFFQNGAGIVQITGPSSIATNGYTALPGGILFQWGITAQTSVNTLVTFPITFTGTPYSCVSTPNTGDRFSSVITLTATQFTSNMINPTGSIYWFAIGHQ